MNDDPARARSLPRRAPPSVHRVGVRERFLTDLYHALLHQTWLRLFGLALGLYLAINALFAGIYLATGGVLGVPTGDFVSAFAFSVQTLTTIGYGGMSPVTPLAHAVVALQSFCGLLAFAMITGLVFAKFSRPTARVLFSRWAVITHFDAEPCLMFRMANERLRSRIVEAELRLTLARDEVTREGMFMRRFYDMRLQRARTSLFSLSWTAVHTIERDSPLAGSTPESLRSQHAEVIVSFVGLDEALSHTVHGRYSYYCDDIVFGAHLADILSDEAHGRVFNYQRFHDVVPVDDDVQAAVLAVAAGPR